MMRTRVASVLMEVVFRWRREKNLQAMNASLTPRSTFMHMFTNTILLQLYFCTVQQNILYCAVKRNVGKGRHTNRRP